jgi:hypothetical protein
MSDLGLDAANFPRGILNSIYVESIPYSRDSHGLSSRSHCDINMDLWYPFTQKSMSDLGLDAANSTGAALESANRWFLSGSSITSQFSNIKINSIVCQHQSTTVSGDSWPKSSRYHYDTHLHRKACLISDLTPQTLLEPRSNPPIVDSYLPCGILNSIYVESIPYSRDSHGLSSRSHCDINMD